MIKKNMSEQTRSMLEPVIIDRNTVPYVRVYVIESRLDFTGLFGTSPISVRHSAFVASHVDVYLGVIG